MLARSTPLTKQKKFISRLVKGIPDTKRPPIWSILLSEGEFSSFDWIATNRPDVPVDSITDFAYFNALYHLPSEYEKQIDLDISRTMRNSCLFSERYGIGQSALFKILVALANAIPTVGYCQGMSSVCGFLLSYLQDDHTTFKAILYMFGRDSLTNLYSSGFPKLFETFSMHDRLLQTLCPKLWRYFVRVINFVIYRAIYTLRQARTPQNGKLSRLSFDEAMYELSSCFEKDLGEGSIKRFELIDAICRRSLSSFKRFRISTSASLPIPSSIDEFVSLNLEGSGENSFSGSAENEIT
ncbi:hypothetical protein DI09_2p100 [Mitosporidium daphniae]|uniref:Rab-GAP TBC domain-containing protein n=1 Tax=Mitosporidium daphniae TaxID=1485682 RepID=A0A098VRF1_9MICR|nr:uncharacterized protein DI09_2p100 [Mitosporidium daphniae]KGG51633.1 hypothetical protein DI09_2p100 [Mitosporidium daphniae]|eukprot:XP_013238060.1 uncharacterized protein DI09_2p100 [Mitosporidium daphniae]